MILVDTNESETEVTYRVENEEFIILLCTRTIDFIPVVLHNLSLNTYDNVTDMLNRPGKFSHMLITLKKNPDCYIAEELCFCNDGQEVKEHPGQNGFYLN
jgi:hypothetical protein